MAIYQSYMISFLDELRLYSADVQDVAANDNCGFRAIAGLMNVDNDKWDQLQALEHDVSYLMLWDEYVKLK
ncbi:hypothetical protein FEM48_Zijuj06G0173600 [Ziziphus jujuba var. spinosa]|uniref:Uncharacterized protein n=1 Tax=Ziziphus jujuba var. spinosa TaxID=714518 RepID=A0A978VAL5_ZIZJJ|nr:hypothetical protein FEM48_Zijuj06G0173600 [Ziziphus jujuba var. spinosa]